MFAQKELSKDYSYTASNPYKVFDADNKLYFYRDGEIMTVKIDKKEILIQKLNSAGDKPSFIAEKLYESKELFPKNYQLEEVEEYGDKYYFFFSSWDGDNEKEQLFYREIDFKKGEFVGENKLMFQVEGKIAGSPTAILYIGMFAPGISIGVQDKFDFLISADKQKMLIEYRKKPLVKSDKKSYDIIGVNAYDSNLNPVWNNELTMPYTERRMNLLDYSIDKEANAYLLVKVFHDDSNDDKKHRKDTEANYHVELFRVKAGTTDIDITKIDVNDKFINRLWLYESPDDYMVCAGFYNKGKVLDNVGGIMVFKVKKDGGLYDKSTHEIPLEILNEHVSNRAKKKNNKADEKGGAEFNNLVLDKLQIDTDGSLVLLGEQYFYENHPMSKSNYVSYHYYDVLVTKIDPSGKLAWMKKLPKRQIGTRGRGGMSYKHFYANNNHYVVYLDNVKNFNLPVDETPSTHSDGQGGYFTSYKINDATGEAVSSSIFNVRDMEDMTIYQFSVKRILQTGDDEFALEVYKKKKEDVMIKIKML
ncbi:hypothetical protein Q766_18795 [Flavobacterium subsaxonicum WB 4.1-42 = DSM 21790]|uniref:Uncharacterized protein n=2 Tax=Flavobacterium TaxID=237 RepID=A0A0A2MF65_9FLAO|nr:hypothetical protein Q766_18795 [Flavobacterium subsaxonicum WB 4.1-42 = DSM 21790]